MYPYAAPDVVVLLGQLLDHRRVGGVHADTEELADTTLARSIQSVVERAVMGSEVEAVEMAVGIYQHSHIDRKSTRLNSSHVRISYAVFCLKKKKKKTK